MDEQIPNAIPPILQKEPQKPEQPLWLVVSVFVGVLIIVGGYLIYQKLTTKSQNQNVNSVNTIATTDQFADWKIYKNDKYNFEIKYPTGWFISELTDGPWRLQSADPIHNSHGIDLPAVSNMWVDISLSVCHNPRNDDFTGFVAESKPDILEASECQDNFYITLGLWQADPDINNHKQILNQILFTFESTTSNSNTNLQTLAEVKYTGGLCQSGLCESLYVIKNNGQLFYQGKLTGYTINQSDITRLTTEIQSTDFNEIKNHKSTGTCPSAYDGQEVIYTFYTSARIQVVSSCEYQIDAQIGVFKAVEDIIKGIPWE